jgi:GNAT superfamily N-acetyltransferase
LGVDTPQYFHKKKQKMPEIIIRKATKKDCRAVFNLSKELAQHHDMVHYVTIKYEDFETFGFSENPVWWAYIAEYDGKTVAFALYYVRFATWRGRTLYLEDFFVTNEMRGKGVGKLLFDALITEAKNQKMVAINWQVMKWNDEAIGFYKNYETHFDEERVYCSLNV